MDRRRRQPRARSRERGIAFLVAVIVFLVVSVVTAQLTLVSHRESVIGTSRMGRLDMTFAFQALTRVVLANVADDLVSDLEGESAAALSDPTARGGAPEAAGDPAVGQPGGAVAGGAGAGGSGAVDHLHENLFQKTDRPFGKVRARYQLFGGSAGFDLNKLFDYVRDAPGFEAEIERVTGEEEEAARTEEDEALAELEEEALAEMENLTVLETAIQEENTWRMPDPERVARTEEMLTRLIEEIILTNRNNGFYYRDRYFPASIAQSIVRYVIARRSAVGANYIHYTTDLLELYDEGITRELFEGPSPELEEVGADVEDADLFDVLTRDEFGDLTYNYPSFGESMAEMYGLDLESVQELMGRDRNAVNRGQLPDDEYGTGVHVPPMPIGLKDVFTTYSKGRINLNLCRREVIAALLFDLHPDDGSYVADLIGYHRNQYADVAEEEEPEALDPLLEPEDLLAQAYEDRETNYYTSVAQMIEQLKALDEIADEIPELGEGGRFEATERAASMRSWEDMGLEERLRDRLDDGTSATLLSQVETGQTPAGGAGATEAEAADPAAAAAAAAGRQPATPDPSGRRLKPNVCFDCDYFTAVLKGKWQGEKSAFISEAVAVVHRDRARRQIRVVLFKQRR